ncbi:MAG: MFS transporter, partial [Polaromonas sp.]|uniref:MFS transporter n=1 Tax=Polaromonas sp. TaxID=1869339 RepID=UPI0017CC67E5
MTSNQGKHETAPAPQQTDWIAVAVVFLSGVLAALQVGKVVIGLPALREELGLSLGAAGWLMAMFALLGVIGGIPAGAMVKRFGDRRLLILGALALGLGSAAGAVASSLVTLLAARLLEGAGFLLVMVAAPVVLQRLAAPRDRDLTFAIWSTFFPTGMAIALLSGAALQGWRGFWLANALLAGLLAMLVAVTVRRGAVSAAALSWQAMARDAGVTIRAGAPMLLA